MNHGPSPDSVSDEVKSVQFENVLIKCHLNTSPAAEQRQADDWYRRTDVLKSFQLQPFHYMYAGLIVVLVSVGTDGGRISHSHSLTHSRLSGITA